MSEPYYEDEAVTLYRGDALRVLDGLPDGCVSAVITDPPYSSGGQFRADRVSATGEKYGGQRLADFAGDNRDQRAFLLWMNLWLSATQGPLSPGGAVVMFSDWRQLPTMTDALQIGGYVWRGLVPWAKPWSRPSFRQRSFLNQCEYVVWGTAGSSAGDETVPLPGFYQATPPTDRVHQTQKPLDVMRELVKIVPEGGTILDPFMGSGTTGVAAVLEGRKFIGVEMTEHYAEVARERITTAINGYRPAGDQMVLGVE